MEWLADERHHPALADRRQRAHETFWDTSAGAMTAPMGVTAAIETATRVQISKDVTGAAEAAVGPLGLEPTEVRAMLAAAFRAAGFEVVE